MNRWQRDPDWDRNMYPLPHEERVDQHREEARKVAGDLERREIQRHLRNTRPALDAAVAKDQGDHDQARADLPAGPEEGQRGGPSHRAGHQEAGPGPGADEPDPGLPEVPPGSGQEADETSA